MGCGEAKISHSVKQKVHSFDLVAQNSLTVACDMSKVQLSYYLHFFVISKMFWRFIKILQEQQMALHPRNIMLKTFGCPIVSRVIGLLLLSLF